MSTTLTIKGQVTIPKHIRDELGLTPGSQLDFAINRDGEIVMRRSTSTTKTRKSRFEAVRGKADIKWRTDDLMALLRGES